MIDLSLRHLRRHWALNGAVLLCLTLASALLVSLSGQSAATAARELRQTLTSAQPAERNLLITGSRYTFGEGLYRGLEERLGQLLRDHLVVRHAELAADPQNETERADQKRGLALVDVYSFNTLSQNVRVLEGRLPVQVDLNEARGSWRPPPIAAVIGRRAAEVSGYTIGDRVSATKGYHRLDIVGIVEPLDPHADLWGEDLRAFVAQQEGADPEIDGLAVPLIVASASMRSVYPDVPVFHHDVSWRITLNHQLISVDRAETLHADLINFQVQSGTVGASTSTGLVDLLGGYLARLSRVRMALLLVTAQSMFFVLYTLTVFTIVMGDRSRVELATLSARGASLWQITGVFALQNLMLALPAGLLLGPGLAQAAAVVWARGTGGTRMSLLAPEALMLSGIAAGLGWLALVLPVFTAARRGFSGWQQQRARLPQLSAVQKRYVDLYLLAFGGLLYWQLNRSGSFVMRAVANRRLGNIALADPLLLIGPSLLLIAAAMVFLRAVPVLLRLVARGAQRLRGLVLPVSLSRLARDPLQATRLVLLISLTAGLTFFTRTFRSSMAHTQDLPEGDALAAGIGSALEMNGLTLIAFSATAFALVQLSAAEGREREGSVLRAMGLSDSQRRTQLAIEGLVVLLLGLLAGTVVGIGLSRTMMPYLSQALAESFAPIDTARIPVDWAVIGRAWAVLAAVYGSTLVLLVLVLRRAQARRPTVARDE